MLDPEGVSMGVRARLLAVIGATVVMASPSVAWTQAGGKHEAAKAPPQASGAAAKPGPTKPAKPMTRREEIHHAIDTRTVPERYRSSVPKEYQKYIPFAKGR
ncbi:hypothetical protein IP86_07005 [Rhodopseudomonas sp. AAP120]|nr:hypothetical protein IP86_07005 [Rhodopseudomonas sp. AAP120]